MNTFYEKVQFAQTPETFGTGWIPPLPDLRDYTEENAKIADMSKRLHISPTRRTLRCRSSAKMRQN